MRKGSWDGHVLRDEGRWEHVSIGNTQRRGWGEGGVWLSTLIALGIRRLMWSHQSVWCIMDSMVPFLIFFWQPLVRLPLPMRTWTADWGAGRRLI